MHSRREFLKVVGAAGLGAGVFGCGVETESNPDSTSQPKADVTIPNSGAELPEGELEVRWMTQGPGSKSAFFETYLPAYEEMHPNITVGWDELGGDKIQEVLPLQLRNGNADTIFVVGPVPIAQMVKEKQIAPLDDLIPDFERWRESFPFNTLVAGQQIFDGKTYGIPSGSSRQVGTLLMYNAEYFKQADIDPTADDFDWDDLRAAAKAITKQGNGDYYGLIAGWTPPGPLQNIVTSLAQVGGASGGGLNWKTGQYEYDADEFVEAVELLKALQADGSFFPGSTSLSDQEARARMPQGMAGMIFSGAWTFGGWRALDPDFEFGVAKQPLLPGRPRGPITYSVGGNNNHAVYAKASDEEKTVAGDLLYFMGTEEGQRLWAEVNGAADPAWSAKALDAVLQEKPAGDPDRTSAEYFDEILRLAPSPMVRNLDAAEVQLALEPVSPTLGDIVQGVLSGQIGDIKAALKDLTDDSNAALDDAIATARKAGAEVSRDDWVFPNWDPTRDYTKDQYP